MKTICTKRVIDDKREKNITGPNNNAKLKTKKWGGHVRGTVMKGLALVFRLFTAVMIILILMVVYQSFKDPSEPASIFGYQPLTVLSNSMNPIFKSGDMLFVKKVDPKEIKTDDVITFREPAGKLITHRVIEVIDNSGEIGFVTKGDNNNVKDGELVEEQSLLGKQVFKIPNAGYIVNFIKSPMGLVLIIFLPLVSYVCIEIYERKKCPKKSEKMQQG